MKSFDVLTIGSATQDVFIQSKMLEEQKDSHAPDGIDACIPLGSKLGIDELTFATGGGATNAAVTFAHFGLKTTCVARVGDDMTAEMIMSDLKREHVDTSHIKRAKGEKSAYSIILVAGSGHRGILTHRGASQYLDARDLPRNVKPAWIYGTSFGGNARLLESVFALAYRTGAKLAWNPGAGELALGFARLAPYLRRTDVLILNKEEAGELAGLPSRHAPGVMRKIATSLKGVLIVTHGEHGAYAYAHGTTWFVGTLKGQRVNTTGAGDAFGSGLVGALAKGKRLDVALRTGALNAHGVITHMGAKVGILKGFPGILFLKKVPLKQL